MVQTESRHAWLETEMQLSSEFQHLNYSHHTDICRFSNRQVTHSPALPLSELPFTLPAVHRDGEPDQSAVLCVRLTQADR